MNSTQLIGRARQRWNEIDHEGLDWISFFNGWLEGRADIVYRKTPTEPVMVATMAATMAATLAGDHPTEGNAFPSVSLINSQP